MYQNEMCFHYFESTFTLLLYISIKYILYWFTVIGRRAETNTVTSSDGLLTVTGSNTTAKKPNQTRRPRNERTQPKSKHAKFAMSAFAVSY